MVEFEILAYDFDIFFILVQMDIFELKIKYGDGHIHKLFGSQNYWNAKK